ncbi:hypothetical protein DCO58_02865 [Helicobacter saguini]|uniref:Glycosyltransferase RgtA/B/C/D-like domain-containing protein n=1 Tax=Helicobacter saguini TaxID=1548018 RepID=A0A347VIF8_9HELI|nr:hypothetical protein [Helicobacter saguini]MWV62680.1 hypothetical protein [Helicobacter saguini]MWV66648.1 hypothetical protein [Helicobacter saguini]MWV68998.1 hypothetical protein [Helicobacter saguini]MWV71448.1 hypothetical protein [Helicobacter saguini]TLD94097.1 hypothetical protein LS64_007235 [Helicobacter saguini]
MDKVTYFKTFNINLLFILALFIDFIALMLMINETSIYAKEARGFFENSQLSFHIANFGVKLCEFFFNDPLLNDFGARLPFVILHILSCILMYNISLLVLKNAPQALFCVILFMLIPGVSIEALIISNVEILTFTSLLIIYYQLRYDRILYVMFIFVVFLDAGGAILTLSLFFYSLIYRKSKTLIFAIICFGVNMSIFSPIHGVPHAYILDILGSLLLLFSPGLFIYYVAILYSWTFHNKASLLNLIPFVGFIFVFLLSTRQQVQIQSFLPELSVALPIFVKKAMFNINSRLPRFRFRYKVRIYLVLFFLILGNIGLFGNKITYFFVKEKNFAYSFYGAKEVAKELYKRNITYIDVPNKDLFLRLRFYGINAMAQNSPPKYKLIESKSGDISIIYNGVKVTSFEVVKN